MSNILRTKDRESADINKQIDDFFKRGGKVTQSEILIRSTEKPKYGRDKPSRKNAKT